MPSFRTDGVSLHYEDTGGDGVPVLLVHAWPLHSGMWRSQIDALRGVRRVLAPDLKGFGGSDAPENVADYSVDSYADDLAATLDDAGVDRAVVVGLSIGGYISFALWRRHRNRIAALVLADTKAEADPPEGIDKRSSQQEQVRTQGIDGLVEALPQALLSPATREKKPDVIENVKDLMRNPAAGYVGALEAMKGRPDSTQDLAGIDVPTLVVVGEDDAVTPPEAAQDLERGIPGARLVVVPEAGHLSNLEAPDAFNGALAEFLGEV